MYIYIPTTLTRLTRVYQRFCLSERCTRLGSVHVYIYMCKYISLFIYIYIYIGLT